MHGAGMARLCAAMDLRTTGTEANLAAEMATSTCRMRPLKGMHQETLAAGSAPVRVAADGQLQGWRGPCETAGEEIAGDDHMRAKHSNRAACIIHIAHKS